MEATSNEEADHRATRRAVSQAKSDGATRWRQKRKGPWAKDRKAERASEYGWVRCFLPLGESGGPHHGGAQGHQWWSRG